MCLACYSAGELRCTDSAYLIISEKSLETVRLSLEAFHTAKVLKGDVHQPSNQHSKARFEGKLDLERYNPSEQDFLLDIQSLIQESHEALEAGLTFLPSLEPTTFRGSAYNPSHTLPLDTLTTSDIARFVGEEIHDWLNGNEHTYVASTGNWKVDLVKPTLNVDLRILGIQPIFNERLLGSARARKRMAPWHPPHTSSQPHFPKALCVLLTITFPKTKPSITIPHGRTSLTSSSAYLLTRLHPFFNPLPLRQYYNASVPASAVLMDPFAGTGSIPYQLLQLASQQTVGAVVICADIRRSNLEEVSASMTLNSRTIKTEMLQLVEWNACGVGGNLRWSTVDGVVSGATEAHTPNTDI